MQQFEMKLLGDVKYCIKVDYFMWSEEKGEYKEPNYLAIDTEAKREDGTNKNTIIFKEDLNVPNIRVFDTQQEALAYMYSRLQNSCCYSDNQRVVKIKYNFENGKWEEC